MCMIYACLRHSSLLSTVSVLFMTVCSLEAESHGSFDNDAHCSGRYGAPLPRRVSFTISECSLVVELDDAETIIVCTLSQAYIIVSSCQ